MNARSLFIGAAAGSALMFILDPNGGGRRRALVRDKAIRATRKTRDGLDAAARDIGNRAGGIAAATRGRWSGDPVSDETLAARVRAKLGRVCSHAHAVHVDVRDGQVTLRGPVLASELAAVIGTAEAVRGVRGVDSELQSHDRADGIPALQGEGRRAGPSLDLFQSNWAPATWAVVSAGALAGAWMASQALRPSHDGHSVM
jgi:hypothetical protein